MKLVDSGVPPAVLIVVGVMVAKMALATWLLLAILLLSKAN